MWAYIFVIWKIKLYAGNSYKGGGDKLVGGGGNKKIR